MLKDCSVQVLTPPLAPWNPLPAMQRDLSCVSFIAMHMAPSSTAILLLLCAFQCASKEITGVSPSQNYHSISMDTMNDDRIMCVSSISKTCPMLPAWVLLQSPDQPPLGCLLPQGQFHGPVSVTKDVSALLSLSGCEGPSESRRTTSEGGPSLYWPVFVSFQEFCFPQKRGNSGMSQMLSWLGAGAVAAARPLWQECVSSHPDASLAQQDLSCSGSTVRPGGSSTILFLTFKAVPLTSVLYSDTREPKL